ncbi:MAG TPA: hypothetical protein DD001_04430 [Microcoleaceae bacterium UBA10368]|jgi:hypothetical protein|nr:hypothetical protein [Microcoleaceae cyanobacterium UBA10368]HCV28999.1 hypothetical protein [Microcoleaceae cyanobacterium UBA9251]
MKRTVWISSTILAMIAVLELCQASKALPTPTTVAPTANNQVAVLFNPNLSMKTCTDKKGGKYKCPGFVMPHKSEA